MRTASLRNSHRRLLRRLKYAVAWKYPRVYLFLVVKLKLQRSMFWRIVQQHKNEGSEFPLSAKDNVQVSSSRTKKILFAIHWYELGGAESYALYTMRKARELGHSCYSVSTVPSEDKELPAFKKYCIDTIQYSPKTYKVDFQRFISDYIREHSIEVVHIHHSTLMYEMLPMLKQQFPEILVVDSTHIVEYGNGGFPKLSAKHTAFIDKHNVISKNLAMVQNDLSRLEYGNSIDPGKYHLTYLSSITRVKHVFEPDRERMPKVVTFYGRLVLQKQPNVFVAVIEHLISKFPDLDVVAHIYGEGEMKADLEKKIERSACSDRFRLFGRCDDKEIVFGNTDILLLTSLNEGIALTAYEALDHSRLAVSSDVGAQSELLCDDCLVPLSSDFLSVATNRLYELLTDENRYSKALSESTQKLNTIRKMEVSRMEILHLYEH